MFTRNIYWTLYESVQSNAHLHILRSILMSSSQIYLDFLSCLSFLFSNRNVVYISHFMCPTHLIFLDLITVKEFGEWYKLRL
jgi:hypothetical protein